MGNAFTSIVVGVSDAETSLTAARTAVALAEATGATVHFVTPTLDHGPIVAQAVVPVRADDTPEALSARVLAAEHVLYPRAVRWFVEGALRVQGGVVQHANGADQLLLVPG